MGVLLHVSNALAEQFVSQRRYALRIEAATFVEIRNLKTCHLNGLAIESIPQSKLGEALMSVPKVGKNRS